MGARRGEACSIDIAIGDLQAKTRYKGEDDDSS